MNNRYICKAKRKDNGEWIEGLFSIRNFAGREYYAIERREKRLLSRISCDSQWTMQPYEVIPETVRQCTTLTDKNGKLIFTGDILHIKTGKGWTCPVGTDIYYKVVFTEFNEQCNACTEYIGFMADNIHDDEYSIQYLVRAYGAEVVGNVYDNPELLEVER